MSTSPSRTTWRSAAADAIDDFPVIVAPPVTYGFTHYNMGEVGTITLGLETLHRGALRRLAEHLGQRLPADHHAQRPRRQRAPTWAAAVKLAEEDVWALALTYWHMATRELLAWSEADEGSIGHGGEWETSLQLYLRERAGRHDPGRPRPVAAEVQRRGAAFAQFPERRREMAHGVMGNPLVASREKGERLFNVLLERLIATLPRVPRDGAAPVSSNSAATAPEG